MIPSFKELFDFFNFDNPGFPLIMFYIAIFIGSLSFLFMFKFQTVKTALIRIDTQYLISISFVFSALSFLVSLLPVWYSQAALIVVFIVFCLLRDNKRFISRDVEFGVLYKKNSKQEKDDFKNLSFEEQQKLIEQNGALVYKKIPLWVSLLVVLLPYLIGMSIIWLLYAA